MGNLIPCSKIYHSVWGSLKIDWNFQTASAVAGPWVHQKYPVRYTPLEIASAYMRCTLSPVRNLQIISKYDIGCRKIILY